MKKILFIHGIGGQEATIDDWSTKWVSKVSEASGIEVNQITPHFLLYDELFEIRKQQTGTIEYFKCIKELITSWAGSDEDHLAKGFGDIKDSIRWTAGMVAQFITDGILRAQLNKRLANTLDSFKPDLIVTHSLGTLLAYDLLRQETALGKNRNSILLTSGSQIGHPALRRMFGGTIGALNVKLWVNINNRHDRVFAYESLKIQSENFMEVKAPFKQGLLTINHDPDLYFSHENSVHIAWPTIVDTMGNAKGLASNKVSKPKTRIKAATTSNSSQKALLIGINDYPDPENQLNGCVNDVFRMSEVLQEMGWNPANIKVVLNERATSSNLRNMMNWLLQDAKENDTRFFFYSGHGAQIPAAEIDDESDHMDECLVTYDFDWSREHTYTDKEFVESYSQLPYGVNFTVMLDCCHSGGMSRDGMFKARGVNPPDDVRHRLIKWDANREMWIPRKLALSSQRLFTGSKEIRAKYTGEDGNTQRFGRGVSLWSDVKTFEQAKKKYGTHGAYMPMIIEACAEKEFAYEYKHGVTSYGAFTFALSTVLRQYNRELKKNPRKTKPLVYKDLINLVAKELKSLGYKQNPQIVGPNSKIGAGVPGLNVS